LLTFKSPPRPHLGFKLHARLAAVRELDAGGFEGILDGEREQRR
jgi:hypothetical protein